MKKKPKLKIEIDNLTETEKYLQLKSHCSVVERTSVDIGYTDTYIGWISV